MMAVRMSPFLSVTLDFSAIYSSHASKGVSPGRKTVLRLVSIRGGWRRVAKRQCWGVSIRSSVRHDFDDHGFSVVW